jgi:outer membrane protein assembly factor BamB
MRNHFNSSLLIGDAIYGFDNATLKCLDLESGEVKWAKRGFGKGSLIGVDDRLLVLSVKGNLVMVEANPEAYHELGSYHALEGKSWTAPSYVGGRVYLRNLTQMACLDLRR